MAWKTLIGSAYAVYALLGNLCLAGLAASLAPGIALAQGPMMSPLHAIECPWVRMSQASETTNEPSPCESGQCIIKAVHQPSSLSSAPQEIPSSVLPFAAGNDLDTFLIAYESPFPEPTESPPRETLSTVVIRC